MPRRQKKTKRCTPAKKVNSIDNGNQELHNCGGDDRLSSLPDNLLISILSLMPTSSAVATSVLSHRWRHLWTNVTRVSFNFCFRYFHKDRSHAFQNFITATKHVISNLSSPKIHTFHLVMPFFWTRGQPCSSLLVSDIYEICLRNPEVIKLHFNYWFCYLPTSLFKTESLVELIVDSHFEFDFGADAQIVINLPKLKILDVHLRDSQLRSMHSLFKSCPLLEHLSLKLSLEEDNHHVNIIAPNLKVLTIKGYFIRNFLLSIDASKLVKLETGDSSSLIVYNFVKKLRHLQEAKIMIPRYNGDDGSDYYSKILALFQGIVCARSITFEDFFNDDLLDAALPRFSNLVDLNFYVSHLNSSSWMPSCLLSNVKIIRIFDMFPDDNGIRVLRGILSNATVLDQLHVSLVEYCGDEIKKDRLWKEYEFSMKLFKLPRSSSSCHIELSGRMIRASCEDFIYHQLTCDLQNWISDSESDDMDVF